MRPLPLRYRIADWLDAQPRTQRVRDQPSSLVKKAKSGKPCQVLSDDFVVCNISPSSPSAWLNSYLIPGSNLNRNEIVINRFCPFEFFVKLCQSNLYDDGRPLLWQTGIFKWPN